MKLIKMVLLTMTLSPCLLRSERGVRRVEIKEEENGKFLVFGSKERGNEVKGGWPSPLMAHKTLPLQTVQRRGRK